MGRIRRRMGLGPQFWIGILATLAFVPSAGARVLLVGTYHGIPGPFHSIQAAVDAAKPGDWILIGPGDYHEQGAKGGVEPAGVLIRTPRLHLRGMNRNAVIVDGTKPGAPACSARKRDQEVTRVGRDGIEPFKVSGVYIENLTVCNFLANTKRE